MRSGISTGKHSLSKEDLEESLKSEEFCEFAASEARMWRNLALDHLTLCHDKLVVFYEDVKRDQEKELIKMLRFLKIPRNEEKMGCLQKHPMSRHRRSKNGTAHPSLFFCDKSKAIVRGALEEVQAALRENMFMDLPEEYLKY